MRKNSARLFFSAFAAVWFVCISGCATSRGTSSVDAPSLPSKGKTFATLRDAVDYFDSQGYSIQGRFEHSQWPATVVREKESLNEISFALKSGTPHLYSGYDGYRLKVVALEDAVQDETVLVFRSKVRKVPATGIAAVNQPILPPGKELDRQLDNLCSQINGYLAAQKSTKIAIVEFSNLDGSVSELGKYIAEELTTRLVRNRKVQVVERKLLKSTLEEQKLSAYGLVDQKTAKAFGSLVGADAIMTGTVSPLDATVRINARLISTETGAVFAAASATAPRGREVESLLGNHFSSSDNFVVLADLPWQNAFNVRAGQTITIRASGKWNHGETDHGVYGPEGSGKKDSGVPLPGARVGALIGRINNGPPFLIGPEKTFTPTDSGMLQLTMNDWGFDNNTGFVNVSIEVK